MSDFVLDSSAFSRHADRLFSTWEKNAKDEQDVVNGVDTILILMGDAGEDVSNKTTAMQTYLLGYEFPTTLMLFQKSSRKVTFVCSASKAKILAQLSPTNNIEIDIQTKGKDEASAQILPGLASKLSGKLGSLLKDKPQGKMVDEWDRAVGDKLEIVDVAPFVSDVLAAKDGEEMKTVITSAKMTSTLMTHYFKPKMEAIIDKGSKVSHKEFADLIEEKIGTDEKGPDAKLWKKNPTLGEVDFTTTEWVYSPIIQSGGKYDLRISAMSNDDPLKPGVILATMGLKYKNYNSSMGRTFMISPQKKQEQYYQILLETRQEALKLMKSGAKANDVYGKLQDFVAGKSGTLSEAFVKNIGFATGIEFRDSGFILGPKNGKTLQENMVIVLNLGFADLPDPKKNGAKYSLLLMDTVKIGQETATCLTEGVTKLKDVVMDIDEDEPEEVDVKPPKPSSSKANGQSKSAQANGKSPAKPRASAMGPRGVPKTRGAKRDEVEQTTAEKIKAHQEKLHSQRQQDGLRKWASGTGGKRAGEDKKIKKYESYRREEQLPRAVEDRRVHVDEQRSTVILPIYGYAVPFHISCIKNVTKTEESEHIVLRINFQSPGQIAGKKEDMPFEDPDATFIRSASFRSTDQRHMLKVYDAISNMKKAVTKKEAERKEMADVIEQERLIEMKGKHPSTLKNVFPRPAPEGKKTDGNLEIHQNGIRFRPDGPANKIDLLFSNIKHLFFQPSEKELFVLIHVHLKSPIMLGKKKTYDVQFYREVTDMTFDETGGKKRRARYGDEDEIEQEQEDRKRRQELDRLFHDFAKRIESQAQHENQELEIDMPFRELGFNGVPNRSNVLLLPTTNCLVHLSEFPATVITLNEVEIVHLERVQFGLKNFDMVFVLNDFKKAPIHVNNIPVVHLDNVKEWLDSCDVPLSEGPVNLSWPQIMKTVNDDPLQFYEDGGWTFLTGGAEDSDESESDEESAYEEDSEAFDESSASDDSESDFNDDGSDDSGSFDESDEGEDWDELERKAERQDKARGKGGGGDDSDDGGRKKKSGRR